jgi:hypothetical protein
MDRVKIANHLSDLSSHMIRALNTRTFSIVAPMYMVATFSGDHLMDQSTWSLTSRDEVIAHIEEFLKMNPDFFTEILDISVDIEPDSQAAHVWIRRTDSGLADGPTRETLMQLAWRLADGEWVCVGYQGVRSFPLFGGLDSPVAEPK